MGEKAGAFCFANHFCCNVYCDFIFRWYVWQDPELYYFSWLLWYGYFGRRHIHAAQTHQTFRWHRHLLHEALSFTAHHIYCCLYFCRYQYRDWQTYDCINRRWGTCSFYDSLFRYEKAEAWSERKSEWHNWSFIVKLKLVQKKLLQYLFNRLRF